LTLCIDRKRANLCCRAIRGGSYSSICDTEEEVIEGCGYEIDEITFDKLCIDMEGTVEIIKIEGDFKIDYLNS
jgi:hypothetical protein